MATPQKGDPRDQACRYHEALATLIKDLNELMGENWGDQPSDLLKQRINIAIANALRIAI